MNSDFPRIITLLRKEKGYSQKYAASELGISQALLSHYEKGIRECGLEFLIKCSGFYGVSCDYLLGRSPERSGITITVDDIPEPDSAGKENVWNGSVLPVLNKKLISNSLNILFDLASRTQNKTVINEVSAYLMLSVYRMFRVIFSANRKNNQGMFTVDPAVEEELTHCAMSCCEAKLTASVEGVPYGGAEKLEEEMSPEISSETLSQQYPAFSSSLLNLVKNTENRILGK